MFINFNIDFQVLRNGLSVNASEFASMLVSNVKKYEEDDLIKKSEDDDQVRLPN
jgi:hypothetical protein